MIMFKSESSGVEHEQLYDPLDSSCTDEKNSCSPISGMLLPDPDTVVSGHGVAEVLSGGVERANLVLEYLQIHHDEGDDNPMSSETCQSRGAPMTSQPVRSHLSNFLASHLEVKPNPMASQELTEPTDFSASHLEARPGPQELATGNRSESISSQLVETPKPKTVGTSSTKRVKPSPARSSKSTKTAASSQTQSTSKPSASLKTKGKSKTVKLASSRKRDLTVPVILSTGEVKDQDLKLLASREKEKHSQVFQPLQPNQGAKKSQQCKVKIS